MARNRSNEPGGKRHDSKLKGTSRSKERGEENGSHLRWRKLSCELRPKARGHETLHVTAWPICTSHPAPVHTLPLHVPTEQNTFYQHIRETLALRGARLPSCKALPPQILCLTNQGFLFRKNLARALSAFLKLQITCFQSFNNDEISVWLLFQFPSPGTRKLTMVSQPPFSFQNLKFFHGTPCHLWRIAILQLIYLTSINDNFLFIIDL